MAGMALTVDEVYSGLVARHYDEDETETQPIQKVPTGISDLDSIVDGGFPSGSTVLLLGDIGAGMQEYIYTAASKIAIVNQRPDARHCDDSDLPSKICYVTFSRSRDVILRELRASFNGEYFHAFKDYTIFKDFSSAYFRHSVVPPGWADAEDMFDLPTGNVLEDLVSFLDDNAHDAIVVIDSLTDLAVSEAVEMKDLVTTVKGLQRAAKRWDGLVYLLLTRGIVDNRYEQMFMDSVDGCLTFEWKGYNRSSSRQRYMYVQKFTSVLPHLPREKIARFPTMVTANHGLVVVYMERIA